AVLIRHATSQGDGLAAGRQVPHPRADRRPGGSEKRVWSPEIAIVDAGALLCDGTSDGPDLCGGGIGTRARRAHEVDGMARRLVSAPVLAVTLPEWRARGEAGSRRSATRCSCGRHRTPDAAR